jgi:hypothetical protein
MRKRAGNQLLRTCPISRKNRRRPPLRLPRFLPQPQQPLLRLLQFLKPQQPLLQLLQFLKPQQPLLRLLWFLKLLPKLQQSLLQLLQFLKPQQPLLRQ